MTIAYDSQTALIVVDVQNDFADPDGSLYVQQSDHVVREINTEVVNARDGGALVVYTQDWHPESTAHFQKDGGIWPVHCVRDTWGAEFHPDLIVDGRSVRKGVEGEDGYSGFSVRDPRSGERSATELDSLLRDRGVASVVVVGLATDYCVKATALDAVANGYLVSVRREAMAAVELSPGDGQRAIDEMVAAGVRVEE